MKLKHIWIGLILGIGLLHIDFNSYVFNHSLKYDFIYNVEQKNTVYTSYVLKRKLNNNAKYIQPIILDYQNIEDNSFQILKLNQIGKLLTSFELKPTKKGYLTYPNNGAFYIWYPSLGSSIQFFDSSGKFLLEKKESRYIKSFSRGEWLMAVSGDHSRVEFVKPNLDSLTSVEGNIIFQYQLNDNSDHYNACLSSISGDIFFIQIKKKKEKYLSTNLLMKAMSCNLNNGDFIVQVKPEKSPTDFITFYNIDDFQAKNDNDKISYDKFLENSVVLNKSYTYTLPISIHPNGFSIIPFLLNNNLEVIIVNNSNLNERIQISLKQYVQGKNNLDDFRSFAFQDNIVLWNTSHLFLFNQFGLTYYKKLSNGILVKSLSKNLIIQENKNIYSLSFF